MSGNLQEQLGIPQELQESIDESVYYFNPLPILTDNLGEDIEFNKEEFQEGVKSASRICGEFTALINAGIGNLDAINIILNKQNIDMNIEIARINKETTIETAKNQQILLREQQV